MTKEQFEKCIEDAEYVIESLDKKALVVVNVMGVEYTATAKEFVESHYEMTLDSFDGLVWIKLLDGSVYIDISCICSVKSVFEEEQKKSEQVEGGKDGKE